MVRRYIPLPRRVRGLNADLWYVRCSRGPIPATPRLTPEPGHQPSQDGGNVGEHLLRRVSDFTDAARAAWVHGAACLRVAALLDAGNVASCRVRVGALNDLEFADAL